MATENWKVVAVTDCIALLQQATQPENGFLPCTKFLMNIKASVRRCLQQYPNSFADDDTSFFLDENNWSVDENEDTIEIQCCNPCDLGTAISRTLSDSLQVPRQAHQDMLDTILPQAFKAARDNGSYTAPKVLHMVVEVDVYVVDKNGVQDNFGSTDVLEVNDDSYEPAFAPASKEFIEKLERARVGEVLTMCSVCMEEIGVGLEATRMPCSHLYHEDCIVEWLQRSRFCPLCRYSLPADQ